LFPETGVFQAVGNKFVPKVPLSASTETNLFPDAWDSAVLEQICSRRVPKMAGLGTNLFF
jgi:hypothetical protein